MKETLVILAAGMGSRYGGLKQIDTVGSNGECIIDFTIYDAIKAGFKKLVLIIKKEHEELFEKNLVSKIRPFIEVEYAFQDINDLPNGFTVPEGREKPWGTTHALLACRHILKDDPFTICNADDFYGRDAFIKMIDFLRNEVSEDHYALVGFKLLKSLSDNGTVTRAECQADDKGNLTKIKELYKIQKTDNGVEYEEDGIKKLLNPDTPVSMNFWGFHPSVMKKMEKIFIDEFPIKTKENPLKYEALLPNHVGVMINTTNTTVKLLESDDTWFGVTYKEDKPIVVSKIQALKNQGVYPFDLWAK